LPNKISLPVTDAFTPIPEIASKSFGSSKERFFLSFAALTMA